MGEDRQQSQHTPLDSWVPFPASKDFILPPITTASVRCPRRTASSSEVPSGLYRVPPALLLVQGEIPAGFGAGAVHVPVALFVPGLSKAGVGWVDTGVSAETVILAVRKGFTKEEGLAAFPKRWSDS